MNVPFTKAHLQFMNSLVCGFIYRQSKLEDQPAAAFQTKLDDEERRHCHGNYKRPCSTACIGMHGLLKSVLQFCHRQLWEYIICCQLYITQIKSHQPCRFRAPVEPGRRSSRAMSKHHSRARSEH